MDKSQYEEKRQELREKVDSLWEKIRNLDDKFENGRFEYQKQNIKKYYINSVRKKYANLFYFVGNEFNKGTNGRAGVIAHRIRIVDKSSGRGIFTAVETNKTWLDLTSLRNTRPADKEDVQKILDTMKEITLEELNKFDLEL